MCSLNGGLFIKVGQHVGALEYLFPREYVQTFKVFHSNAPQTPLSRMKRVVEEELGRPGGFLRSQNPVPCRSLTWFCVVSSLCKYTTVCTHMLLCRLAAPKVVHSGGYHGYLLCISLA